MPAAALDDLCNGIDCIVHFAGVLFTACPSRTLPVTNVTFVQNLVQAAICSGVKKFILISFPHAEGETTPARRARGSLDAESAVIHFRTRLAAERYLIETANKTEMTPVVFRAGIVYGRGIKLIEGARWMMSHHVMAVWRRPTWAHLLALPDFLTALQAAVESEDTQGIYQVCDDAPLLLQDLLDRLADHWGFSRPVRLPKWMFFAAGGLCEAAALTLGTAALLNRDIVRAGMTSCVADTSRMKRELLPTLSCPTIDEGLGLLDATDTNR